ncbi:hypothetical protein Goari_006864, partial [Gossypium aridum]|nr:hypothetical protein [Gossypium aridum]
PNCIILAISPANQDIATSDAIKLARDVDPSGERTFGVLTKLDLMDKGTNAVDVLEGRAYRLQQPWVGIVNRSQADINKNVDMILARRKEREYFETSPDYGHLASRMGSEYLAKLLSEHLELVIRQRIPSIIALINKTIDGLNAELDRIGRPIATDGGAQLYMILELCRAFDRVFKEHLDGGRPGGDRIFGVFDNQLPAALKKLPFDRYLSLKNVQKVVTEADGYQPHLIAPEQGYRRLIDGAIGYFKGPAEASVDAGWQRKLQVELIIITVDIKKRIRLYPSENFQGGKRPKPLRHERAYALASSMKVHYVLKELVRKSIAETQSQQAVEFTRDLASRSLHELKRFPSLQTDIATAANESLEKFRDESRKTVLRLVEMESSYLTADFFRKLNAEPEKNLNPSDKKKNAEPAKNPNQSGHTGDRLNESYLRRIGSNVNAYIAMVCDTLRNTIPKAVVYCQVKEAKRSLLTNFYAQVGSRE